MTTTQDTELRNRLDRLVFATESAREVLPRPSWQEVLIDAGAEGRAAHGALSAAEDASAANQGRNAAVALRLRQSREVVEEDYAYVYEATRHALLTLKPAERRALGEDEIQRRERLVDELCPLAPSALKRARTADFKTRVEKISERFKANAAALPAGLADELIASAAAFAESYAAWLKEGLDDDPIQQHLEQTREEGARIERALRMILDGLLLLGKSPLTAQSFIEQRVAPRRAVVPAAGGEAPTGGAQEPSAPEG